ncbi:MAG: hypothetical protein ABI813_00595 [Bacteroidota bacterium]
MKIFYLMVVFLAVNHLSAFAQHKHHMMHDSATAAVRDTIPMMDGMDMCNDEMNMDHSGMSHSFSLQLPMSRNGSGTGWLPDASPMYGYLFHTNKWMYMLHGNLFLRYNKQDLTNKGSRGAEKFDAPDWLMLMGQRPVAKKGLFRFSAMLSLDALTGGNGYPLLFQSGEAYKGNPIVDRQHPHDLFTELSVGYTQALSKKTDLFVYFGYPGEPALGPVAFMHRPAALDNPDAPLSHHWADATHITFGVATIGIRYNKYKLEASSFTGREPDDRRFNFDKPRFDSWSGRLSYNPTANWALQVSHGFLKNPEILHPGNLHRTTASAVFSTLFQNRSSLNATLLWGMNKTPGETGQQAVLAEASWGIKKWALHTRYEWVQKSVEELNLNAAIYDPSVVFPVNAFTLGFHYNLLQTHQTRLALGSQISLYHAPAALDGLYGKNPLAAEIYLRVYPGIMKTKM